MSGLALAGVVAGVGALAVLLATRSARAAAPPEPAPEPDPEPLPKVRLDPPPPPPSSEPPPGAKADDPSYSPAPRTWYQVQRGDTGVGIAARAYGLPRGAGAPYRAWLRVRSHPRNRVLSPDGVSPWDGRLVSRHDGHAPRGSGSRFPVVWIPEA